MIGRRSVLGFDLGSWFSICKSWRPKDVRTCRSWRRQAGASGKSSNVPGTATSRFYALADGALLSFLIIAAAVYFFVVVPVNALIARARK